MIACPNRVRLQVDVQAKYSGYIERQQQEIERQRRNEETALACGSRLRDSQGTVERSAPASRRGCGRIVSDRRRAFPGVTPAAISLLLIHLKKRSRAA